MKTIIYNIGTLAGILPADVRKLEGEQMNSVECIENAYLVIEDGVITEFGKQTPDQGGNEACEYIDAKGGYVMPATIWVGGTPMW